MLKPVPLRYFRYASLKCSDPAVNQLHYLLSETTLNDLLIKAQELKSSLIVNSQYTSLRDRLIYTYENNVLEQLINHCFAEDNSLILHNAQQFLNDIWQHSCFTCVGYTARPDAPLTDLLCQIAEELDAGTGGNGLKFLMPSIKKHDYSCDEEYDGGYFELKKIPLSQLLRTHIIGADGNYLVPVVHILLYAEGLLGRASGVKWKINPYYTTRLSTAAAFLREHEITRLWQHSADSKVLHEKTLELISSEKEQPTLLSQLRSLHRGLSFNNSHGGVGQDDTAGEGVYSFIIRFFTYYDFLLAEATTKALIPEAIIKELEELRDTCILSEKYDQSCLGQRAEAVYALIKTHEQLLETIIISSDSDSDSVLKKLAEQNYQISRRELNADLTTSKGCLSSNYLGSDEWGFTAALIQWLNFSITIESEDDVVLFMQLTAEDMQILLQENPSMRAALRTSLNSIEKIASLLTMNGYRLDSLRTVLECLLQNNSALFSPTVLIARIWEVLDSPELNDKQRLICELFMANNINFIDDLDDAGRSKLAKEYSTHAPTNGWQFILGLACLDINSRAVFLQQQQHCLTTLIKDGWLLGEVLYYANTIQRQSIFDAFYDSLHSLIKNGNELSFILLPLNIEQRNSVLELFCCCLPTLIKNGNELSHVLNSLIETQHLCVVELLHSSLPTLIKNGNELSNVLEYLVSTEHEGILKTLDHSLTTLITNSEELSKVLVCLEENECAHVLAELKDNLPLLIKDGNELSDVLGSLELTQRISVLDTLNHLLPKIINNGHELSNVLILLDSPQCTNVLISLYDNLPRLIKNSNQLCQVLDALDETQHSLILNSLNACFFLLINDANDLSKIRASLNATEHARIWKAGLNPELITPFFELGSYTLCDLFDAFNLINPLMRVNLIKVCTNKLLDTMIVEPSSIIDIRIYNGPEHYMEHIELLFDTLPDSIHYIGMWIHHNVCENELGKEHLKPLISLIKKKVITEWLKNNEQKLKYETLINLLINDSSDLNHALANLDQNQCLTLLGYIESRTVQLQSGKSEKPLQNLNSMIHTVHDLNCVLAGLTESQCNALLSFIRATDLIQTVEELHVALNGLKIEQFNAMLRAVTIDDLIQTEQQLHGFLEGLDEAQFNSFLYCTNSHSPATDCTKDIEPLLDLIEDDDTFNNKKVKRNEYRYDQTLVKLSNSFSAHSETQELSEYSFFSLASEPRSNKRKTLSPISNQRYQYSSAEASEEESQSRP